MKIKYVPVLRYIREERKALMNVKLSNKTLPLLELVNERAAQKRTGNFQDTYLNDIARLNHPILVDIPIYMNVNKGTRENVKLFLSKFKLNPSLKVHYYTSLAINNNIIPTLSYEPKANYIAHTFINDCKELRKSFKTICFRIFNSKDLQNILLDIKRVIKPNDILIFDIKNDMHNSERLKTPIAQINKLKEAIGFTSVIIRSAINPNIIFNKMLDGYVITEANNSLLYDYAYLGFDAFGDYVGIRKDSTISKGGSSIPSAGFIFYSWHINSYLGYRGRFANYDEFIKHIKPSVTKSLYWLRYTYKHHQNCPGCQEIITSLSTHSWDWKRYSIEHYLYTMEENL
ncbi:beta family protein [Clostridium sp. 'White wine YQ']|uniref:beta family protein n=1 Tax=Clostridium sp. 'White wine YQ' TaxID=3027474 RepID=UPI0023673F18|nr:hypothetical protein [Clostridium sp. 'White wine YQ']MDD7794407.1 hypothetical protein [Clostridium sp. 'White wine YQ']